MSSEWELDEGIKSIKSAWRREHTARANLEKMLEQAEADNAELRELVADAWGYINHPADATWTHKKRKEVRGSIGDRMRELGVKVE